MIALLYRLVTPRHSCLDHLDHCEHASIERHGLDCGPYETYRDEHWRCAFPGCGAEYREAEVRALLDADERRAA